MIKGVTKGYEYKMRLVYAHFPINVNMEDGNRTVAIRNYIGEKEVMKVPLLDGMCLGFRLDWVESGRLSFSSLCHCPQMLERRRPRGPHRWVVEKRPNVAHVLDWVRAVIWMVGQ
jgi:hypothetical protein